MPLFDHWPYVDLSKLNLDWLLSAVKQLQAQVKELMEKSDDADAISTPDLYNAFNSTAWLQAGTSLIGTVPLLAGHVVCSAEYYNGYLYVAHHRTDADDMYISKYSWPQLELITRAIIDSEMHGNGLGADAVRNVLILSNGYNADLTNSHTLYLIDPDDLSVTKRYDYAPFGNVSLSSFDVSPDGESAAALITGSNKVLEYDVNPDTGIATAVRIHNLPEVGDGIRQDGSLTDTFYYQLFSNNSLPEYSQNQVVVYSFRTGYFKTLYLDNSGYDELEGISRIRNAYYTGLILVDCYGKVYFCDTSNKIIASGLLTKKDNVCAGTPQYQITNPFQLRTPSLTNEISVTSDNYDITAKVFLSAPSFDLSNYSLRQLEVNQDAWKVHFGWYYAPLCFGDRYFLTGVITTLQGGVLLVRYGYYDTLGGIQLSRAAYKDSAGNYYNATYDGSDTTALINVVKQFIDDNHNEMQENISFYPEIWNISEYARTGDIWNISLA